MPRTSTLCSAKSSARTGHRGESEFSGLPSEHGFTGYLSAPCGFVQIPCVLTELHVRGARLGRAHCARSPRVFARKLKRGQRCRLRADG
jgi:hypothetical protein